MLSQLTFKLSVEKQYKDGIEKLVKLYEADGDRKSRADAVARGIESTQKIQLLKQALKRYEDLHVEMDTVDSPDGMIAFFSSPSLTLTVSQMTASIPPSYVNHSVDIFRCEYMLSKMSVTL